MLMPRVQPVLRVIVTSLPTRCRPLQGVQPRSVLSLRPELASQTSLASFSMRTYTTSSSQTDSETGQTGQAGTGSSRKGKRRARLLTVATASATAVLGSLYLLYQQSRVKADGAVVVQVKKGGEGRRER